MISQPQSTSLSTVHLEQAESTPKRITNISYFTATVKPLLSTDTNTTIYFITPTYSRITQKVDLTTLCQTLMMVPKLIWIVVEDSPNKTPMVTNLLTRCNVMSVHMNVESPDTLAIEQRYLGLKWVRDTCRVHSCNGVVYFGDDDNKYDLRLFETVSCDCVQKMMLQVKHKLFFSCVHADTTNSMGVCDECGFCRRHVR